jgi:hypothetical protein
LRYPVISLDRKGAYFMSTDHSSVDFSSPWGWIFGGAGGVYAVASSLLQGNVTWHGVAVFLGSVLAPWVVPVVSAGLKEWISSHSRRQAADAMLREVSAELEMYKTVHGPLSKAPASEPRG